VDGWGKGSADSAASAGPTDSAAPSSGADLCYPVVLRVAWTLADLAGIDQPGGDQVAEALVMRLQRVAA
jgi:magnesium chelatase family protein